jgi:hypothetical protein
MEARMLTVDDYAKIRIAHRDGMSILAIARTFQHSRRKVREILPDPQPKPSHFVTVVVSYSWLRFEMLAYAAWTAPDPFMTVGAMTQPAAWPATWSATWPMSRCKPARHRRGIDSERSFAAIACQCWRRRWCCWRWWPAS